MDGNTGLMVETGVDQLAGRSMDDRDYIQSKDMSPGLIAWMKNFDPRILAARDLEKFQAGDTDLARNVCLPTTTLMALKHMGVKGDINLMQFYELGINAQINDRVTDQNSEEKGYPSFHRRMLDTYLRYAVEFSKICGLPARIITNFKSVEFARLVINKGGVVICSVDNLFIPHVMNKNMDPLTFKPSRHAELIHGYMGNKLLVSDVTNFRNGLAWTSQNRWVPVEEFNSHITCTRLNDNYTRAIFLAPNNKVMDQLLPELALYGQVEAERDNPILSPFFGKGIKEALDFTRRKVAQGLAQWEMIE